ncbi:3-deoxy-D-manno-octulosonic acid transferase [Gimesia panareensis]|uniref:3-deoxy-D-manno-octulosonic acid transferase n=1 Tax=Gimesia panareensis TaxID=2527978 RepID=UPI00118933F5|nr:3-deoxy-D-manno-octulosonic acid transferase [Gimesia panareensis]QDU49672.1 3-deoxy-D-manno-octulosonic acid transferase [Gimesia panareensis]
MRLFSYLLNLAYGLLLIAVSPVLAYRVLVLKKYRSGWSQKFLGKLPERDGERPCFWFHAVSVGEVLQLPPLIAMLAEQHPELEFVISTTTHTGYAVAQEKFPDHTICYFPLDFSWAVKRGLKRIRPAAVILVEMELWPNFVLAAEQLQIPISIINGRLSEKSFRGYRRLRALIGPLLNRLQLIAVQTDTYAARFAQLSGTTERIQVTGSIKFDGIEVERSNPLTRELREAFQLKQNESVLIAGSTQDPEERIALEIYLEIRRQFPDLRLILVPRHQERFEDVATLVRSYGLPLIRRSHQSQEDQSQLIPFTTSERPPVCLLDTLGELKACWGLADYAFVGGSLTKRGGQNMIEPAGYGAALMFGPNTWNFKDIVAALLQHQAATVVRNQQELQAQLTAWLQDPESAREQGARAQAFVMSQRGATQRTAELLAQSLVGTAKSAGKAA